MRIHRFELVRYGKFTDASIDFGAAPAGQPDLHVIYGANEAGKSTLSNAIVDLLYGMGLQNSYDFLHPYPTMRLSGVLDMRHGSERFVRIKKNANSLLDRNDNPVPETMIGSELGGLDRLAYRMMFCLDEKTLAEGGQGILESKGDLGKLLFAASAGLEDLHKRLAGVRDAVDQFSKKRTGRLHELKQRAEELKAEREKLDTFAGEYARLVQGRTEAKAEYNAALKTESDLKIELRHAQSLLRLLPELNKADLLRQDLAARRALPLASKAMVEQFQTLHTAVIQHAVAWTRNQRDIVEALKALDAVQPDPARAQLVGELKAIEALRSRYETAAADLPQRRQQQATALATIRSLLSILGKADEPDPERLLVPARSVGALRALSEKRSGVNQALQSAGDEWSKAHEAHDKAKSALLGLGARDQAPTSSLRQLVVTLKDRGYSRQLTLAQQALSRSRQQRDDEMLKLAPWSGAVEDLVALACPALATVQRWRTELDQLEADLRQTDELCKQKNAELAREQARHKRLQQGAGDIGDETARQTRHKRDAAWSAHRAHLSPETGDVFEQAMRADDALGERRFAEVAQVTEWRALQERLETLGWELDALTRRHQDATNARTLCRNSLLDVVPVALRTLPPTDLERWVQQRDQVMVLQAQTRDAEHDLECVAQEIMQATQQMRSALSESRIDHDEAAGLADLLQRASEAIDQSDEIMRIRKLVEDRAAELERRAKDRTHAQAADADWTKQWATACGASWFSEDGEVPSVAVVREYLAVLEKLRPEIEARKSLAERIRAMEGDQETLRRKLDAIAPTISVAAKDDTLAFGADVLAAIQREAANALSRETLSAQLAGLRDEEAELKRKAQDHESAAESWKQLFGAASLDDVLKLMPEAERKRDDQARLEDLERSILVDFSLASLEEAHDLVRNLDRAGVESQEAELSARLDDQTQRTRDHFAALSRAEDRLAEIGGDGAVAELAERRRTVLLEIEDGALQYLKLSAGALAAEMALRSYREKHRSSMLTIASDAFSAVTCGAYSGLTTQPSKDRDVLIATEASGGSKSSDDLSTGARAQLYLALRVAGYHEYVRARSPVPFIADDIMETFDDARTAEAIRLLSHMSRSGQVIYLTHHRHLCDIVRDVAPEAKIHHLP